MKMLKWYTRFSNRTDFYVHIFQIWMFSPSLLLENHITHDILFSYPYELYRCASAAGRPRWSKIRTAHTGTWDPSRGP